LLYNYRIFGYGSTDCCVDSRLPEGCCNVRGMTDLNFSSRIEKLKTQL
jgi:hypothetical protein